MPGTLSREAVLEEGERGRGRGRGRGREREGKEGGSEGEVNGHTSPSRGGV